MIYKSQFKKNGHLWLVLWSRVTNYLCIFLYMCCTDLFANFSPGTEVRNICTSAVNNHPSSAAQVLDKGVTLENSFEGYASELRQCQNKMRNGIYPSTEAPRPLSGVLEVNESDTVQYKATFVWRKLLAGHFQRLIWSQNVYVENIVYVNNVT